MNDTIKEHLLQSISTKQKVIENIIPQIEKSGNLIRDAILHGNKILVCGNGGSAADSQHLAAEFTCRYDGDRRALPAIALCCDTSHLTAAGNDYGFDQVFSRGVSALGNPGDVLVAISTSGNSPNVILAIEEAKKKQMSVIGLLGKDGGKIISMGLDCAVVVPSKITAHIQESHITIIHIWCKLVDLAVKGI